MGGITSKNFEDLVSDDSTEFHGRVLPAGLDPRSPSTQICRTPIQVRRSCVAKSRNHKRNFREVESTPKAVLDPRSPSTGIDRTPIYCSRSLEDLDLTPITSVRETLTEGTDEQRERIAQPNFDETPEIHQLEKSTSEPDLSTVNEDTSLIRQRAGGNKSLKNKPKKMLRYSHTNSTPEKTSDCADVKASPERSPLKILSDGAKRSPLANRNVDINSPRNILQRKHITKIALLKSHGSSKKAAKRVKTSPQKYQVFDDEKENRDSS